jgi:hypothetical protein
LGMSQQTSRARPNWSAAFITRFVKQGMTRVANASYVRDSNKPASFLNWGRRWNADWRKEGRKNGSTASIQPALGSFAAAITCLKLPF